MPELDAVAEVAESVGRRACVEFESVEILAFEHRTVVRLQPAPVVVKIALASDYPSLERELAVAPHVAAAGGPAVPPLDGAAAGPQGQYAATLWPYLPSVTPPSDIEGAGVRSYCQLRKALDSCPGDLPDYTASIFDSARTAGRHPLPLLTASQIALVRDVLDATPARLAALTTVSRPLHGDPHLDNRLFTTDGPFWLDFESACRGP